MATKPHSYSLRVRAPPSNGAKTKTPSRPAPTLHMPPTATVAPSIETTNELRSSNKNKISAKRSSGTNNVPSKAVKSSSKKRVISSRSTATTISTIPKTAKRSPADVSDMEDFQPTAVYTFGEEETASIQSSLLSWYDENHRVLPWRQNSNSRHQLSTDNDLIPGGSQGEHTHMNELEKVQQRAYEVWISEIMLQQTRVATVILYYHKWMEKWPTLQHLAVASLEEVYCVWAGLGYYRRARFLLEGAKQLVEKHSGVFPGSLTELRKVPGIGNYTAGAIASIAFNMPVPVVDGNIIRVLCRLQAISESPKSSSTVKLLWTLAEELVDDKRPGDLNQALMELGATVCTPKSPACSACPIASHCKALSLSFLDEEDPQCVKSVTQFPGKVAKVPPREEYISVCVLEVSSGAHLAESVVDLNTNILVVQRPKKGLLAGLWEFPSVALGSFPVSREDQQASMDDYLQETLGIDLSTKGLVRRRETLGTHRHIFSHIRWHMFIEWLLVSPSGALQRRIQELRGDADPVQWVAPASLRDLGLTSSVRKIYEMYLERMKTNREKELGSRSLTMKRNSLAQDFTNKDKRRTRKKE